jgi:hypothetical protein
VLGLELGADPAGVVASWIRLVIAARRPAPAPIARRPIRSKSSLPPPGAGGVRGGGGARDPGIARAGGGIRIKARRAASLVWIIPCMIAKSSAASSIVI